MSKEEAFARLAWLLHDDRRSQCWDELDAFAAWVEERRSAAELAIRVLETGSQPPIELRGAEMRPGPRLRRFLDTISEMSQNRDAFGVAWYGPESLVAGLLGEGDALVWSTRLCGERRSAASALLADLEAIDRFLRTANAPLKDPRDDIRNVLTKQEWAAYEILERREHFFLFDTLQECDDAWNKRGGRTDS